MHKYYQNAIIYTFFILAVFILGVIIWAGWCYVRFPYDGLLWSAKNGEIETVDPFGPAEGRIFPGDRILSIDGQDFFNLGGLYANRNYGDTVEFILERQGKVIQTQLILVAPSPTRRLNRLLLSLVTLTFWIAGMFVLAFKLYHRQSILFFLVCQIGALTLIAGSLSSIYASVFFLWLYGVLYWWIVPLIVHFHIYFPSQHEPSKLEKLFIWLLYATAALATPQYLIAPYAALGGPLLDYNLFYILRRLWLAIGLFGTVFLLGKAYVSQSSGEARQKIRLLILGAALALLPFLSFSLLPDVLFHYQLLPYNFSFVFFLFIPLFYVYAILRYQLIPLDHFISRAAASVITLTLLIGIYWLIYTIIDLVLPQTLGSQQIRQLLVALFVVIIYARSANRVTSLVDRVFYGGGADYPSLVKRASQTLVPTSSQPVLASNLLDEMQDVMQMECGCLLLGGTDCDHSENWLITKNCWSGFQRINEFRNDGVLNGFFAASEIKPLSATMMRQNFNPADLEASEAQLLDCRRAQLWFPLRQTEHTRGLLLLGPRRGGGYYPTANLEILDIIARQASIAFENIYLIQELNERNRERIYLNQQMLRVREDERKTLSRDLHDNIIQALIGLDFQISQARRTVDPEDGPNLEQFQQYVREVISSLRQICTDLRPPVLDSLGLVAAIRYLVRTFNQQSGVQISLSVDGNEEQILPEDVELSLFRSLQEALNNIRKHAGPCQVSIALCIKPESVTLEIADDGAGFVPPEHMGALIRDGHFGLIGIQEQIDLVEGNFAVHSVPGEGSRVVIQITL